MEEGGQDLLRIYKQKENRLPREVAERKRINTQYIYL